MLRSRYASWLVLAPLIVNALTGPFLVATGEDGDERIVGVLLTAFCVLGAVVVWAHRREPARVLWWSAWTVPVAFAGTAAVMVLEGAAGLGGYYAVIAVASALGLALDPAPARPARVAA